jgi:hypothetical protein
MFSAELMVSSSKWYGRVVRSGPPVPMLGKLSDGFDEIFNFSFSKSWMRYERVVRSGPTVPMVGKLSDGFTETLKFRHQSGTDAQYGLIRPYRWSLNFQ